MNTYQHLVTGGHIAQDQCDVGVAIHQAAVAVCVKLAPLRGHLCDRDPLDQLFSPTPVADQVFNGDDREPVLLSEPLERSAAGHRPVWLYNLADDPGWSHASKAS